MNKTKRGATIESIVRSISSINKNRPLRVAVNGRIASGKTTFAKEIAQAFREMGTPVLSVGVDGYHNPQAVRYRQGRDSAKGYYEDAYDLEALKRLLLEPIEGPPAENNGIWAVRTESFDLANNKAVEAPEVFLGADHIVIVDGSFLLVPSLQHMWDFAIYIEVERALAAERGAQRDAQKLNGVEEARRLHEERYQEACDLYIRENQPGRIADAVLENTNFDAPILTYKRPEVS